MSGKNGANVSIISKELKGVKVSDVRISPKDPKSFQNDVKADEKTANSLTINHVKANDVKVNDVKLSNNSLKVNSNHLDVEKNSSSKNSLNTDASPSKQTTASTLKYREREQWDSKVEFVLSCVAFSIGLGNVWRFPYLAYKNGGGAFFIPYFTCLLVGGIPIYFLEVAIGQYFQSGGITVWKYICPLFKGVGYGTVTICFILNCYYIVILAWALLYLTYSFHWELPWSKCGQAWNTPNCWREGLPKTNKSIDSVVEFWENEILQITDGIDNPGGLQWWLVGTLFIMWVVCGLSIWRGIKSTGKSVYVTAIFPYFTLIVLFIRGITLPGALNGIKFYLSPDFSKLTEGSSQIWIDAGTQIFFSYAIALGTMTALGSYNKFNNNFYHQLFLVCCMNSGTSVFAGFAIFSVIGFMAYQQNTTVAAVTQGGPGLAFIAYPKGVVEMPLAPVWAVFFFVMILLLGTGSQFVAMEGFVTAVVDVFPHYLRYGKRREWFIAGTCLVSFLIGLSMVSRGGMYVFQLFDYYGASGICLLWMCFFESAVVAWFYGWKRFDSNLTEMLGFRVCSGFLWCWKWLTPIITTGIFAFSIYKYEPVKYNGVYEYPTWAILCGWALAFCSILQIPIYIVYRLFIRKRPEEMNYTLKQRLHAALTPIEPQQNR